jgi:glycosyltransferase involved in cell wall biosynthesis
VNGRVTERRLRVLTLVDTPTVTSGAERLAARVAARVDQTVFEPFLCASRPPVGPTLLDALESLGVPTLELNRSSRRDAGAWRPLVAFLREKRVDVLHAHKFGSNVWGTIIGRLAGVPVVIAHEHSWQNDDPRLRRLLDRFVIGKGADAFVAVSPEDRRRMIEIEHISPELARYVPTGIPAPRFSDADIRGDLGIPDDAPVLGAVSVLRPIKALDVLIRASAMLRQQYPSVRVLIVGSGPDEQRLRSLAGSLGLGEVVAFLGARRDVPDVIRAFDIGVCCSDAEGLPASVLEYMACGAPVIATRVGAIPHIIRHGEHGLLIDPQDPAALAAAASTLLVDRALRIEITAKAQALQRREFDIDIMVSRLERLYVELFARTDRARTEGWRPTQARDGRAEDSQLSRWGL